MNDKLAQLLRIAPPIWPGPPLGVQPGDLSRFAPVGLALDGPLVMMPWDTLDDVMRRPGYYGANAPSSHPFLNAPVNDDAGGVVYFDGHPEKEQLEALFDLLSVRGRATDYAAFWAKSENPMEERYLEQLRIVSTYTLASMFQAEVNEATSPLTSQTLTVSEALWAFVGNQQEIYNRGALSGVMGGDGDWAKESLAFGFMVENAYNIVYRIWSRAWLVTK